MRVGEEVVTYVGGLIALAVVIRYGDNVSNLIKGSFGGVNTFASTLLNPGMAIMPPMIG
jgi:predicted cobalt transporter CbtA